MIERIIETLEANDVNMSKIYEQDGEYYVELEWYSPAGEDVIVTVWFNGSAESFVRNLEEYAEDFDVDEHAEMYIPMRGTRGVPDSISVLVKDAEAIQEWLYEISEAVRRAI